MKNHFLRQSQDKTCVSRLHHCNKIRKTVYNSTFCTT